MGRYMTNMCPNCKQRYLQDWEDPDECPYCDGGDSDDKDDRSDEADEWGGTDE